MKKRGAMDKNRLLRRIAKGVRLDSAVGVHQVISVDDRVKSLISVGKPVTAWEVVAQTGYDHAERVSSVLDELTDRGVLVRFRAGFIDYYALPKIALTGAEPTAGTVIADSLKSLFLNLRCKVISKLPAQDNL